MPRIALTDRVHNNDVLRTVNVQRSLIKTTVTR